MPIEEFCDLGLLQEINRTLLHPLGLDLRTVSDPDTGAVRLGEVIDLRESQEYVVLDSVDASKVDTVSRMWANIYSDRVSELGFMVQPV